MKHLKPIEQASNADLRGSMSALQRAAQRARELAIQTGTALVVSQKGVIVHLHPKPDSAGVLQEPNAPYGKTP
ncbi:hypothetical protein [Marinospirillum alkaliphilum]|uniref:Uncharacterized protein n=1 Tax=Marinospirillum alkaliphilum DSM 21637 TaxID=1122209 RepID=A0A1K1YWA0_9GAMM|nr:hypothetical protein [Marinospirillum alkaliphilum]SFX65565.1 hypothetical protein SAMN02745752_02388 [Marinospirillum alkaliphilum DSM 21637]